jgi:dihydrofolate reductase
VPALSIDQTRLVMAQNQPRGASPEAVVSTVIGGDLEEVSKLNEQYNKDVAVHGSGQLTRSLFDLGLVDELRLMIFVVVIREGEGLFDGVGMYGRELADLKPSAMMA